MNHRDAPAGRELWVDLVKGLAIIGVMWQHCASASPIHSWIGSFDVTVFLVLSGYLLSWNDRFRRASLRRDAKRYLLPYLYFSVIAAAADVAMSVFLRQGLLSSVPGSIYKTLTGYGLYALWFIPSFLIGKYLFTAVQKRTWDPWIKALIFLLMAAAALLLSRLTLLWKERLGDLACMLLSCPVVSLGRGLMCAFSMAVGFASRRLVDAVKELRAWWLLLLSAALLAVCYFMIQPCDPYNISELRYGDYPLLVVGSGLAGSFGLMFGCMALARLPGLRFRMLRYLGVNSIVVMLTHMTLKLHFASRFLAKRVYAGNLFLSELLAAAILTLIELVIIYLLNRYLGFLIGKEKPKPAAPQEAKP